MAKGLRSSVKKANKARLRSNTFGPVEKARKERLSAKLLEQSRKGPSDLRDSTIIPNQLADTQSSSNDDYKHERNVEMKSTTDHSNSMIITCENPTDLATMRNQSRVIKPRKKSRTKPRAPAMFFNSRGRKGSTIPKRHTV